MPGLRFTELVSIMKRLMAPDGCPWDREQTLATLKPFLLEETYEVLDAMESDAASHCEELGDLLMQIVFQAELRAQAGAFSIDDVVKGISDKLVRRHPHVFGGKKLENSKEVLSQWSELKEKEKVRRTLDGIPRATPALLRATRMTERAAQVGFDWPDASGARAKVSEELSELDRALASADRDALASELGDLLFAIVNLARKLDLDAESALTGTIGRFEKRFAYIEDRLEDQGRTPRDATLAEMDALWNEAKRLPKRD